MCALRTVRRPAGLLGIFGHTRRLVAMLFRSYVTACARGVRSALSSSPSQSSVTHSLAALVDFLQTSWF